MADMATTKLLAFLLLSRKGEPSTTGQELSKASKDASSGNQRYNPHEQEEAKKQGSLVVAAAQQ